MMWKVFLLGALWCMHMLEVCTICYSACLGTTAPCEFYSMNCSEGSRIQVDIMQQGLCNSTTNLYPTCKEEEIGCCANKSNDCFEDCNQDDAKSMLLNCSGHTSCGPMQDVRTFLTQPHNYSCQYSNYIIVDYSCLNGTSLLNLGRDLKVTELEVNVIFNSAASDTIFKNHSTNYTCTIVDTRNRSVKLKLVDIRLQKPGDNKSCSSVRISIPDQNYSVECSEEKKQQNEGRTNFGIDIFNQSNGDYAKKIWIKLEAYSPYTVSVTCRDQKFPDDSGGKENKSIVVIIGVLVPVLFLIVVAIVGVIVIRHRHQHSLEKKTVVEIENLASYDESAMGEHNTTSSQCSHCSNEEDDYMGHSQIPEECASRVDRSSTLSHSGFEQNRKDTSVTNTKSDNYISNTYSVQYVNTVEDKSSKRNNAIEIETSINALAFESKYCSVALTPESVSNAAEGKKTTDKVLKVIRSADDYLEFVHGELYDQPKEPKSMYKNDIGNKQKQILPKTAKPSCGKSSEDYPVMCVYDYAVTEGGNGCLPVDEHLIEDNMYEAVDDDRTGTMDDCVKSNDLFINAYVDEESSSIKCYHIDSVSMENKNVSLDESHENIQPPKVSSNYHGVPQNDISQPASSLSAAAHGSLQTSSLSSNIPTSPIYVNSPRLRAANKPITASKPNATDGYANSPKLWAGKRKTGPSELTANGGDFKNKGNERHSNVVKAILSTGKYAFDSQGETNSFTDNVDSET